MRLIACSSCHTQYDVSQSIDKEISCRCGEKIENRVLEAVDAQIHRCGSCGAQVDGQANYCDYCGSSIVRDRAKLSLICPECYARNAQNAQFCSGCGVSFDPESVEVEGHELPCPCCGALMPPIQIGGVSINECTECNGLWVPDDKFNLLVDRAIEAQRQNVSATVSKQEPRMKGNNPYQQRVQYRKCPECEAFMQRRNFRKSSGVIIDACSTHGTWLDADELEQIAGFILSGGRPEADRLLREESAAPRASAFPKPSSNSAYSSPYQQNSFFSQEDAGDNLLTTVLKVFTKVLIS